MDQGKTMRVLRHGSEVEIPESEFNPQTDTRLDGKPAGNEAPQRGADQSHATTSENRPTNAAGDKPKR